MVRWILRCERSYLTVSTVIDLTDQDKDSGNHPAICVSSTTKLPTGDKENKGKQPLETYMQFKGRGRYKLAKCAWCR